MPTTPSELADQLQGSDNADVISALGGDDIVYGGDGEDELYGDGGNDALYGGDHNDTLYGGDGNDWVQGDGMIDLLYGGDGNDQIQLGVLFSTGTGSAYGGTGNDTLRVYETTGSTLRGGDGIDVLDIYWNPLFIADNVTIDFNAGIARSGFGMNLDFAEFERLSVHLGLGDDTVKGSALDDFIWVDGGANLVEAGAGNDTVRYQIGEANTLDGGAGSGDVLVATGNGGPIYFIYDGYEGDVDDGQLSQISGFERFEVIGDGMNDIISTGNGNDVIYGNGGDDSLYGMGGNDTFYGGAGADEVYGSEGRDSLVGDAGNDTLSGDGGFDTVTGSAGADELWGGGGSDYLNGGWGYDRLFGGAGADSFYHLGTAGHGTDWINDYSGAEGDALVSGIAASGRGQYQVNYGVTAGAGDAGVAEAFVIYRPTGQILWAIVDGAGQENIWLRISGQTYDLTA